jgi:3-methyladenine DNA glycosylase/8-oxoguanine DNA glycosylase
MATVTVGAGIVAELTPPWPFRLPARGGPDGVSRVRDGVFERFLRVDGSPVLIRAWEQPRERTVRIAALPVESAWLAAGRRAVAARRAGADRRGPCSRPQAAEPSPRAERAQLEVAIERARSALGVDDDYGEFYARFKRDPLLGPAIRRLPWLRVRRCLWPWESLAWAVTEQLVEVERAHQIQRRIVARWSPAALPPDRRRPLRDVPAAAVIAGRAPAELAALDLAPKRALALIKVAREVAAGRVDLERPDHDRRLLAISEIGPWTVQVLGQKGRGEANSLPAGDLAYLKLVPRLIGMDRRATVAEVESFYAPFAPFRGWAGLFTLVAHTASADRGKPLKYHPPRPELEAA